MCGSRWRRETWSIGLRASTSCPHRQLERQPQHDPGLLGPVVRPFSQLLDEPVAAGDSDLAQRQAVERRGDQGAHVALVQVAGGAGDAALRVDVRQPVRHEVGEQAVRRQRPPSAARIARLASPSARARRPRRWRWRRNSAPAASCRRSRGTGCAPRSGRTPPSGRRSRRQCRSSAGAATSDHRRSEASRCSAIHARTSETANFRCLPNWQAAGPFAVQPPVVDGGDGQAEVRRQLGDVHERFQAPGVGAIS
ncbi:hypothetical protein HD599_001167 [Conyzicola lurida]|uniref:Uncharacterized protein n=1 Tax=Conyzicola lurida TaxID=1172621 RepID=A0A841AKB1_9MICO|nr:hypothetical protein [Conyzicola lurida]